MFDFYRIIKQSKAKIPLFALRGKLKGKRGNYIKSQLFLFYEKTVRQRLDE